MRQGRHGRHVAEEAGMEQQRAEAPGGERVAGRAHHWLRRTLTRSRFRPGGKLKLRRLAEELGVSLTPVRKAIARLGSERALEQLDHRSARVPPFCVARPRAAPAQGAAPPGLTPRRHARARREGAMPRARFRGRAAIGKRGRMIIALGSDHAGLPLKRALKTALEAQGHAVLDAGTHGADSVDYPDFAHAVAARVAEGAARFGVLVCGSGIGMAMAANRHPAIRAAVLHHATEARLTRAHNDANIACFGARTTGVEVALDALAAFLSTAYEGGRHDRRLAKLTPGG